MLQTAFPSPAAPRGLRLPGGVPVIGSRPINAGLVGCWGALGEGGAVPVVRDLVSNTLLLPTGSPTMVNGPIGMYGRATNANYWSGAPTPAQQVAKQFTLMWFGSWLGAVTGSGNPQIVFGCQGTLYCWALYITSGSNLGLECNNGTGNFSAVGTNPFPSTTLGHYCVVVTCLLGQASNAASFYFNGRFVNSAGNSTGGTGSIAYTGTPLVYFGASSGSYYTNGTYLTAIWNRVLSPGDAAALSADPTMGLDYPDDDLWSLVVGKAAAVSGRPRITFVQMCAGSAAVGIWRNPTLSRRRLLTPTLKPER